MGTPGWDKASSEGAGGTGKIWRTTKEILLIKIKSHKAKNWQLKVFAFWKFYKMYLLKNLLKELSSKINKITV